MPPPDWVIDDYTGQMFQALSESTLTETIPTPDLSFEQRARIATMISTAGLALYYRHVAVDGHLPVFVFSLSEDTSPEELPADMRVSLSDADKQRCEELKESYKTKPENQIFVRAFKDDEKKVKRDVASLIVGRVSTGADLMKLHTATPGQAGFSTSVALIGTTLDISSFALEHTDIDAPLAKVLVNCAGFTLTTATLPGAAAGAGTALAAAIGTGAGLGLAILGVALVGTNMLAAYENAENCVGAIGAYKTYIMKRLNEESRAKQIAKGSGKANADYYNRREGNFDYKKGDQSVDNMTSTDVTRGEGRADNADGSLRGHWTLRDIGNSREYKLIDRDLARELRIDRISGQEETTITPIGLP